jgi:quinol monooxygenase YgiN
MSQVSLLARFTAKEGKGDEIVAAFQPIIDQVRNELPPGTLLYVMNRARTTRRVFTVRRLYADDGAFAAHGASEAMAESHADPRHAHRRGPSSSSARPVLAKDLPGLRSRAVRGSRNRTFASQPLGQQHVDQDPEAREHCEHGDRGHHDEGGNLTRRPLRPVGTHTFGYSTI